MVTPLVSGILIRYRIETLTLIALKLGTVDYIRETFFCTKFVSLRKKN